MTTLEERLRRDLQDAEPPADPSGVVDRVLRKAARRHAGRTAGMVVLCIVVVAGSIGGVYGLSQIFGERAPKEPKPATPASTNEFIIVSRELPGEGQHLFAVSPDGSGEQRLTPEGRAVYREPDVSPDGRVVVVAHEIPSFEPGQSVLATVPIDGGSPTWLAEETWVIFDPAWSPDGARIAFAGSPGGPFGIYVFDIATGETRLVPGTDEIPVGQPTWSPDGATLAFEASTNGDQDPAPWDIYSAALDGSDMTNLTNTPDVDETQPAWSWAVDRIAFIEAGPAEGALRKMAPDGMDAVTVYSGELVPGNPVWSPDGTSIAFQVGGAEVGEENILVADADGDGPLVVPNILGTDPAWQPVPEEIAVDPEPTPTDEPRGEQPQDIGLGFPVCTVTSVSGEFAPGDDGTAFVATRVGDTELCRRSTQGPQVLAVDISGDGVADASYGPLECESWCSAYAAPDVDGDGLDEVLVQNIEFSVPGLHLFDVDVGGPHIRMSPVTVEPPGDAVLAYQGFDGSAPPQFWIGGDGHGADALRCEEAGDGRVLISSTAKMVPPGGAPDSVWQVHETTFVLQGDVLRVIGARDYDAALDDGSPFATTGCGAELNLPPFR